MKMRRFGSRISQLGLQEWLIHWASFPPTDGSITHLPSPIAKKYIRKSSSSSGTLDHRMRRPVYSIMRWPFRNGFAANTPRPWTRDRFTITCLVTDDERPVASLRLARGRGLRVFLDREDF